MIDCSEATRLTAATPERPLSLGERIGLALHRLLCPPCRFYRRQLEAMRRAARDLEAGAPDAGLGDDARARIREKLRRAQKE